MFFQLDENPICLSLYSNAVYQIADQKPAQIKLYDYYNPAQQLKADYSTRQTRSLADSCPDCWPEPSSPEGSNNLQSNGASSSQVRAATNRAAATPKICGSTLMFAIYVPLFVFALTLARFN